MLAAQLAPPLETPLETQLETMLLAEGEQTGPRPRCRMVMGSRRRRVALEELRAAIDRLPARDVIVYVIPLVMPPLRRLVTLAILPFRVRDVEQTLERSGLRVIGRFGVDPRLDAPALVYQLNSAAARYADRSLRPRSPAPALRRWLSKWSECDPSAGAVLIIGARR